MPQSGAFGSLLVLEANALGYGVGAFVSFGNQADLAVSDYIAYLSEEPDIGLSGVHSKIPGNILELQKTRRIQTFHFRRLLQDVF